MRDHLPKLSLYSKITAGLGIPVVLWSLGTIVYVLWFAPPPSSKDPVMTSFSSAGPMFEVAIQVGILLAATVISVLHWFAARHYLTATRYDLLKATAWLSLIPCSALCLFSLPFGIYALVVLYSDEVKKLFADVERGKSLADALSPPPSGSGRRAAVGQPGKLR